MGSLDDMTWFALALTLTVLGLATTVLLWRLRGPASGLRSLAWTLLPGAAYLTGTLRLVGRIVEEIGSWAVRLVLSPAVWAGVALAGVAAVLFVVASGMRRRGVGTRSRTRAGAEQRQVADRTATGRPVTGRSTTDGATGAPAGGAPAADDDLADIEAILRKHGIS